MTTPTPDVTPGYMTNTAGHLVPVRLVSDLDMLRDQTVRTLVHQALNLSELLAKFKAAAFSDIAEFVQTSAEQYDVKRGGGKGNVTLVSYDGKYKVVRALQDKIRFDERLVAAKSLIDECITEWSETSPDEMKVLVNMAFEVDKEGKVNVGRVLDLRRYKISNPKWRTAMQAISDSLSVIGSKSYVRFFERVGETDEYKPISLDIARL